MKKQTNLTTRRKWVVTGIMAFAGVALLTTGFATYIVGVNNNTDDATATISVETVKNTSVDLSVSLEKDNTLNLTENVKLTENDSNLVNTEGAFDATALQVTADITLKYGSEFFDKGTQNLTLKFSLKYDDSDYVGNISNLTQDEDNLLGSSRVTEKTAMSSTGLEANDSWEYLVAPAEIDLTNQESTTDGALTVITLQDKVLDFRWGSFFDGMSPANYYNSMTYEDKTDAANKITQELKALNAALDGKSLTLTAEVVAEEK